MVESPYMIDDVDKELLDIIQQNPSAEVSEIAEKMGKSQTIIGARILKLERRDLLSTIRGLNAKKIEICLASAEICTKNPIAVMNKLRHCPYVINAFRKTGSNDVLVLFASKEIASTDEVLNRCYRTDPNIKALDVSYIFEPMKDFVFPINFAIGGDVVCRNECNNIKNTIATRAKSQTQTAKTKSKADKSIAENMTKEQSIEAQ